MKAGKKVPIIILTVLIVIVAIVFVMLNAGNKSRQKDEEENMQGAGLSETSEREEPESEKNDETALGENVQTEAEAQDNSISEETVPTETEDTLSGNTEEVQETSDSYVYLGDSFVFGDLQFTFEEYDGSYTDYRAGHGPKEGYTFIRLEFYIENISSQLNKMNSTFYPTTFDCYADNVAMNRVSDIEFNTQDGLSRDTLSPGRAASGALYYEVPVNCTSIEVEYTVTTVSDETVIIKCQ